MSHSVAEIRRGIAMNMGYWGGDIGTGLSATTTATGLNNTLIDTTRPEPDDEWGESTDTWIVLNPGSTDQVNKPTIWRKIASVTGWVQATGTFTILGTWPAPYTAGVSSGVSYELYKAYRPETWLNAINWALRNSFPQRHFKVNFEILEDPGTSIIDWGELLRSQSLSTPTLAPTLSQGPTQNPSNLPFGNFQAGTYTVGYSYYNDVGETLISPTTSITLSLDGSIDVSALTGIPAQANGIKVYVSSEAGNTTLGRVIPAAMQYPASASGAALGHNLTANYNGQIDEFLIVSPPGADAQYIPQYNTTNVDIADLRSIQVRINPGQYPEIWQDLGSDLWKPLGGDEIQLDYRVTGFRAVRFVCMASLPPMANETDQSEEPLEVLYAGADVFLWKLLIAQSPAAAATYRPLLQDAIKDFEDKKNDFALDPPRKEFHRPKIIVGYPGNWW